MLVATTNDLPGYRVTEHLGMVRGVTVRSRSVVGNIGGAIQSIFGGNITIYTRLAETARQEAYDLLVQHAREMGADAVWPCATTPTKSWRASPRSWPTARR